MGQEGRPDEMRDSARRLLLGWQAGQMDLGQVLVEAEKLAACFKASARLPEDDPRSIGEEVVLQLELLHVQWITTEDIPAFLAFLEAAPGDATAAWLAWRAYWAGVDVDDRRRRLTGHPFYTAG